MVEALNQVIVCPDIGHPAGPRLFVWEVHQSSLLVCHVGGVQDQDINENAVLFKLGPSFLRCRPVSGIENLADECGLWVLLGEGINGLAQGGLATSGEDDGGGLGIGEGMANGESNACGTSCHVDGAALLGKLGAGGRYGGICGFMDGLGLRRNCKRHGERFGSLNQNI